MRVNFAALAFVFLSLSAFLVSAADTDLGTQKYNELLQRSKDYKYIPMTGSDFEYYVRSGPRPYQVLAFLTSNTGSCGMCNDLKPELHLFAESVENDRYLKNDTYQEDPQHRIFVIEFDGSANYQTFSEMGLKTVPHLQYISATRSSKKMSWKKTLKDSVNTSPNWKAEDFARNLHVYIKRTINIERPPEPIPWASIILTLTSGVGVLYFFLTVGRPFVMRYLSNPFYYLIAALLFYGFCVGGGMYNRIRNTPWMGTDHHGNPQMINPSNGSQYGAETYTIGGINLMIGAALVVMTNVAFDMKLGAIQRNMIIFGSLIAFGFLWSQLRGIYSIKNGSYNMGFVWH